MPTKVARTEGGISVERLTTHKNENYNQPGCNDCSDYRWRSCQESGEIDDCIQRLTWIRLLAIEDILGDEYDLDRLRELAQADREGRCVVPVVRCQECKYLNVINDPKLYAHCPKTNTVFLPFDLDTREHFCSLGQQKIETVLLKSDTKDESLEADHEVL